MRLRMRFFWLAHDLIRPSFARRSGLREGGKPVPIPDHVENMLFGIMRAHRNRALIAALIETQHWGREGAWRAA